jgi:parallel beta-helix repeat protein
VAKIAAGAAVIARVPGLPVAVLAAALASGGPALAGELPGRGVGARPCPVEAVPVEPGRLVQAAVDAAPTGAAFCLKDGVHRMQVVRPKAGQRFYGEGGAVLSGARLLTKFAREGSYFVAEFAARGGWRPRGTCTAAVPACDLPQTLYLDERALAPVARKEDVGPGRFFFDASGGRIYFADDPAGRKVEVAVARFAFGGSAEKVGIVNLTIEKYASVPQHGAIEAQAGWTVEDCEVRLNSAAGIRVHAGTRVADCKVHDNGQIGIAGPGDGITVENSEVWANNTRGYDSGWEAGGVKVSGGAGVVLRGNYVHDNDGPGLWCDGGCRGTRYENNRVERNRGAGIFHEISYAAVIRGNVLANNGSGDGWFWRSEIVVAASEGVEIAGNRLLVGADQCGIVLVDQGRDDGPGGRRGAPHKTRDNTVVDNDSTFEGAPCAGGASDTVPGHENFSIIEDGNNRFDRNFYRAPASAGPERFAWGHAVLSWDAAQREGFEPNGRLVRY